jgi:hypothetical protein
MTLASSRARGRAVARALVERMGLRTPIDIRVEAIAWSLGAEVVEGDLVGAAARLVRVGARSRIRLSARLADVGVRRFSVAHELGHLVLEHASSGVSLCHEIEASATCRPRESEAEANGFAAELLMPEKMVRMVTEDRPPSLTVVHELAKTFGTSLTSSAIRMTEVATTSCAAIYVDRGVVRWAARSPSCDWALGVGALGAVEAKNVAVVDQGASLAILVDPPR